MYDFILRKGLTLTGSELTELLRHSFQRLQLKKKKKHKINNIKTLLNSFQKALQ